MESSRSSSHSMNTEGQREQPGTGAGNIHRPVAAGYQSRRMIILLMKKWKGIYKSENFPFLILAFLILFHHYLIQGPVRDDIFYAQILNENTFFQYLTVQWNHWSSRIALEAVAIVIAHFPMILWKLLDAVMYTLLGVVISKLFITGNRRFCHTVLVCLMLIYPLTDMATAGWSTTTMTYLWPGVIGLAAFLPLKKAACREKVQWYEYIICIPFVIYAASLEQMNIILVFVTAVMTVYLIWKERPWVLAALELLLSLGSLYLAMICPGNGRRQMNETQQGFVDFGMITFMNKVELGYSATLYHFIVNNSLLFSLFCLLIAVFVFRKYQGVLYRIIGAAPAVICGMFWLPKNITEKALPGILTFADQLKTHGTITIVNFDWKRSYVPVVVLGAACCAILISMYLIYGNTLRCYTLIMVILVSFATRLAMGFSPTIWRSNTRTFLMMYFAFVICCCCLVQTYEKFFGTRWRKKILSVGILCASASYLNSLMSIF